MFNCQQDIKYDLRTIQIKEYSKKTRAKISHIKNNKNHRDCDVCWGMASTIIRKQMLKIWYNIKTLPSHETNSGYIDLRGLDTPRTARQNLSGPKKKKCCVPKLLLIRLATYYLVALVLALDNFRPIHQWNEALWFNQGKSGHF